MEKFLEKATLDKTDSRRNRKPRCSITGVTVKILKTFFDTCTYH